MLHIAEPLSCQGFYATRIAARRVMRGLIALAIVAASLIVGTAVLALAALDFVGVVTWGMQ